MLDDLSDKEDFIEKEQIQRCLVLGDHVVPVLVGAWFLFRSIGSVPSESDGMWAWQLLHSPGLVLYRHDLRIFIQYTHCHDQDDVEE